MNVRYSSSTTQIYRIRRADRASNGCPEPGSIVYPSHDAYGCANDDGRVSGIEYMARSSNTSGEPFFTIPREDCQLVQDGTDA